jgi:hypothetical protein
MISLMMVGCLFQSSYLAVVDGCTDPNCSPTEETMEQEQYIPIPTPPHNIETEELMEQDIPIPPSPSVIEIEEPTEENIRFPKPSPTAETEADEPIEQRIPIPTSPLLDEIETRTEYPIPTPMRPPPPLNPTPQPIIRMTFGPHISPVDLTPISAAPIYPQSPPLASNPSTETPSRSPAISPVTGSPTVNRTRIPIDRPTDSPSMAPQDDSGQIVPTTEPTSEPVPDPTPLPTPSTPAPTPTRSPTFPPTVTPSESPTTTSESPTTDTQSLQPSLQPSLVPSIEQFERNSTRTIFEAAVVMVVSDNFLSASQAEVMAFSQLFLFTFNQWETLNETACDPFQRMLVNITETQRNFEYSRRGRRDLEEPQGGVLTDLDKDHVVGIRNLQDSTSVWPSLAPSQSMVPSQSNVPSSAPTFGLTFNRVDGYSDFFLGVSGTCDGCESDDRLFDDAVAVATYRRRKLHKIRSLQESCAEDNDLRAPLAREILEHFRVVLEAMGLPYDVINLREVLSEACPAPSNAFTATSEESTYTILTNAAITSDGLNNALGTLTDPTTFVAIFAQFTEDYCDRLYRRLTVAVSGTSEVSIEGDTVIITLSFQSLEGVCRGCENLFGIPIGVKQRYLREGNEKVAVMDSARSPQGKLQSSVTSRTLQEDLCWCNTNAIPRAPVQDEFELYLTAIFEKIVGASFKT